MLKLRGKEEERKPKKNPGFSSQAGTQAYSAKQILGEPNKYPAVGDSPVAWAPSFEDVSDERYIKVAFQKPMPIQQVMVAESKQAGSVGAIYLFDRNQKEILWHPCSDPLTLGKITASFFHSDDIWMIG